MDDDEFVRLADNNKGLIAACSNPAAGFRSVVQDHDVVYGLYPSQQALAAERSNESRVERRQSPRQPLFDARLNADCRSRFNLLACRV